MIPLSLLPTILGGVQGIAGAIGSLSNKRPTYKIPAAVEQGLSIAEAQAGSDLPAYAQTKANLGTATGTALNAAREAGNPLAVIGQIQANQNKALNDLGMQNAAYKDQKQSQLRQALDQYGDQQAQAWQVNEFAPYAEKKQFNQNLFGAGVKNIMGGLDSMNAQSMIANQNGNADSLTNMLTNMFKKNSSSNTGMTTSVPSNTMLYGAPTTKSNSIWG